MAQFRDKFIGFVDILGFKALVEAAEAGKRSIDDVLKLAGKLDFDGGKNRFKETGYSICPESKCNERHLDFEVTQISDCVLASSEISPAGVINLVQFCWTKVLTLLVEDGVMCRGYITRGSIFHEGNRFVGTGYQNALEAERNVAAFKRRADERGTPFVEVDRSVCEYVAQAGDRCVQEMFSRFVKGDGEVMAIFPFQRLSHSFMISGWGREFRPANERKENDKWRSLLKSTQERVLASADVNNEAAMAKVRHYLDALEEQLRVCDEIDQILFQLERPFPRSL